MSLLDILFGRKNKGKLNTKRAEVAPKKDEKLEVADLVQALYDYDPDNPTKKKQDALVKLGEPAIEPLIQAIVTHEAAHNGGAVETLGRIGAPVVDPLIGASRSEDSKARQRAISAILDLARKKKLDLSRAVDCLIEALGDQDEWTQAYATVALGEIGDKKAVEPLVQLLAKKRVGPVAVRAAQVLADMGDANGVDGLVHILQSGDQEHRVQAAYCLGRIRDPRGLEPLIRALADTNWGVRSGAAKGLKDMGDPKAIAPLREALRDEHSWVREAAAEAMALLGQDQESLSVFETKLFNESTQSSDRSSAAMVLARSGDKGLSILLRALNSDNPGVYFAAARAINFELMKQDKCLDKGLYESLKPASSYLASIVGKAEASSGSARPYDEQTSSAIASLKFVGNESAVPALETLLNRIQRATGTGGERREYVRTDSAAGFISSNDSVNHVKSAIAAIKSRASLLRH